MACSVELTGKMVINSGACGSSCSGSSTGTKVQNFGLSCAVGTSYDAVQSSDCKVFTATNNLFQPLPNSENFSEIQLLSVLSDTSYTLRLNAAPAVLVAVGGSYPTGFQGGEGILFRVNTTQVVGWFTVDDQTVTDVVRRINSGLALAGADGIAQAVERSGQVAIVTTGTGPDQYLEMITGSVQLGLIEETTASGSATDIPAAGNFFTQFGTGEVTSVEIKINGQLSTVVAGRV